MPEDLPSLLDRLYRSESGRILATLIRLLGDFDLAEDAMHEAFRVALEEWPQGIPKNPTAWLISAGRFKGIDRLRHQARTGTTLEVIGEVAEPSAERSESSLGNAVPDDRLRLIFICCHPSLPAEACAALSLREICGLTTEEIARAFLSKPAAMAQRIVRAKNKIREDSIPYEVPSSQELPSRLDGVLQVIYLVFNEGYSASSGPALTRADLSLEAIRLGRLVLELLPEPEVQGLLALMLLQESRRLARIDAQGELVLLDEQDRTRWNQDLIKEGVALLDLALATGRAGRYTLQAAIAALHAQAKSPAQTDWNEIAALYDLLLLVQASPVVELNRAVAVAMRDGPAAGLALVDDLLARGELDDYPLLYSVRADLYRRLGNIAHAHAAYQEALKITSQEPERRFLEKRLRELH
jgi:RNA polymerase sigma-70 factor (ECF subfamily)